ncbi:MAG: phosphatidylglycerophosphatase A [Candidatus Zixiibacteriota bacterium]
MTKIENYLVRLVATGLYSGYSPLVPGTVGTIPAWLIGFFLIRGNTLALIAVCIVCFFVSVWASGKAEISLGHDCRKIVIDEWAGMFLTFLFVPYSLTNYVIAFVAFRAFDVIKAPPAGQLEKLPGGWGVTMDDVVAGVQANIVTQVVIYLLARLNGA